MPQVGKKHFGYGPEGKAAAAKEAKRTGKEVVHKKNPGYVVSHTIYKDLGRIIADSNMDEAQTAYTKKVGKYVAKHKAIERQEKKRTSRMRGHEWGSGEGTSAQAGQMSTDYGRRAASSEERGKVAAAKAKQGIETGKRAAQAHRSRISDSTVPEGDPPLPSMSKKDKKYYEGRPSRKEVKKKKFEAGQKIFGKTKKFTPGGGRIKDWTTYKNVALVLLGETRSKTSRIKTTARKATAEHQKRKEKGKSIGAEGAGRRARTAKAQAKKASKPEMWHARRHHQGEADRLIAHGKSYKTNQEAANKALK